MILVNGRTNVHSFSRKTHSKTAEKPKQNLKSGVKSGKKELDYLLEVLRMEYVTRIVDKVLDERTKACEAVRE